MAFRLDKEVAAGVIDNTQRGRTEVEFEYVSGERVKLLLSGNCWRDAAGSRIRFKNQGAASRTKPPEFVGEHHGVCGDITASRQVKIPSVPVSEFRKFTRAGREIPFHWSKSLYLEWFSSYGARFVIELGEVQCTVEETAWVMTEAEEARQMQANREALKDMLEKMVMAVDMERVEIHELPDEADEFDCEKILRFSDHLCDVQMERLDAGLEPEFPEPPTAFMEEVEALCMEDIEEPEPWEEVESVHVCHPWVREVRDLAVKLRLSADDFPQLRDCPVFEEAVVNLMQAGGKGAGALNSGISDRGMLIAMLKRVYNFLHEGINQFLLSAYLKEESLDGLDVRNQLFRLRDELTEILARVRQGESI